MGESRPDWAIARSLAERLGIPLAEGTPADIMDAIRKTVPGYEAASYPAMAAVEPQWPEVGGSDLYFGGTSYENRQGLGVCAPPKLRAGAPEAAWIEPPESMPSEGMWLVPVERLLDRGTTVLPSEPLRGRLADARVELGPSDAGRLGIAEGQLVELRWDGRSEQLVAALVPGLPSGAALVPRSTGVTLTRPVRVEIRALTREGG
jgi:predicted molibdopterin-dependent oxidoreductase YjgC